MMRWNCWPVFLLMSPLLESTRNGIFGILPAKAFSSEVLGDCHHQHDRRQQEQRRLLLLRRRRRRSAASWSELSLWNVESQYPLALAPTTSVTRVVVVGAGISGLSVAYHLQKFCAEYSGSGDGDGHGDDPPPKFDITLLEGRDAIGGRIRPVRIDGDGCDSSTGGDDHDPVTPIWIDLGAQWLHESTSHNPIRRLLEDDLGIGFVGHDQPRYHSKRTIRTNVLFDEDGTLLDPGIVKRARTIFYKARDDTDALKDDSHADVSLRDLLDARTELELSSDRRMSTPPTAKIAAAAAATATTMSKNTPSGMTFVKALNYFVDRTEGHEGGRFHEISASLVDRLYEGSGSGPDRVVEGSYRSLLNGLARKLGLSEFDGNKGDENSNNIDGSSEGAEAGAGAVDGNTHPNVGKSDSCRVRLRCNARVKRIEYGNDSSNGNEGISISVVENETPSAANHPEHHGNDNDCHHPSSVETAENTAPTQSTPKTSVVGSDYCVCTVPLGVLQDQTIEFVPPLPEVRQAAIDGIGMGLLNKIVFRFDFVVPDGNDDGNRDDCKFWGDLRQFGICHEDPSRIKSYFDCTADYCCSSRDADSHGTATTHPGILVQFLSGAAADRVDPPLPRTASTTTTKTTTTVENDNTQGLTDEEAIAESLAALRSVFGKDNVPIPSFAKVTRWREDPWSRGSYSFPKTGSTPSMYDEMATPLCEETLLFAGEHTIRELQATVHGAWDSGAREARRIWDRTVLRTKAPPRVI